MNDEIIERDRSCTIVRSSTPSGAVPYDRFPHEDGNINYGWVDLSGHPERVALIPEAARSPGLSAMLRAVADPRSQLMSAACDCAAFNRGSQHPAWEVGGYITVMYQDGDKNVDSNKLIELARQIRDRIQVDPRCWVLVQFIVEPITRFFDRTWK
jgi:hypothetical protein